MAKLKISIRPLFIIYVIICLYFSWTNVLFFYVMAIALHEFAHYVVANKLGYDIHSIVFSISGAGLHGNCVFNEKDDIKISLAGPLVNLLMILFLLSLWWIYPTSYLFTYDFFICNISVMCFNLLPIYPLDGGRVLMAILAIKKVDKSKVKKAMLFISFVIGLFVLVLFVVSVFYNINYNLLIIGMFMTINSIIHDNNRYYSSVMVFNKDLRKPLEIRKFIVDTDDKVQLLKLLSPHYYSVFIYKTDTNYRRIEESDLIN